jgi:hypothetical protein
MSELKTYEERIACIAALAPKHNRRAAMKRANARARNVAEGGFTSEPNCDNINHYTDASKYAEEYYGGVYRDTIKYDREWD